MEAEKNKKIKKIRVPKAKTEKASKPPKEFKPPKTAFGRSMRALYTLTVMQLKDKFSFSFAADKKGAIMKISSYVLGFIVITAACFGVIYLLGFLNLFSLGGFVPVSAMTVIFTVMLGLSIITCLVGLTDTLYFSNDNQVLLAFPVAPNIVFLSKLNVYYFSEVIKNFLFIVPLFLAYGMCYSFVWYYYFWILFCFLLIAAIPVIIAALLSLVYMWVKIFLKKYPIVNSLLVFAVLIGAFTFLIYLITLLPENINIIANWGTTFWEIQAFLNGWSNVLSPVRSLVDVMVGRGASPYTMTLFSQFTVVTLAIILSSIIAVGLIAFFLAKPMFFKMATKPFEFSKKKIAHDYKLSKQELESQVGAYIFKIKNEQFRNDERKYRFIINKAWKENFFTSKRVSPRRIARILKEVSGLDFEYKKIDENIDLKHAGPAFIILKDFDINHLVLLKRFNKISYYLFDPIHLEKKNFSAKTPFLSSLFKEFVLSLRAPEIIISNFVLFSITPLAVLLLNKIFSAMNTKIMGGYMVVAVNVLIILLLMLSSSISFASIYSKEGASSYLLKSAPVNYTKNLLSKLVINTFVMLMSTVATGIIFYMTNKQNLSGVWLLFIAIFFVYLGHVLWSAELDFMNPQDKIYATTGTNVSNPNETKSTVFAFVIAFVLALITFFLLDEDINVAFIKILFVGIIFFGVRLYLFITRIRVYNTERGETGK